MNITAGPINKPGIPKIIHQIWLGPRDPPIEWMNTWKKGFCKKYKWKYMLWRDNDIKKLKLKNQDIYDTAKSWQQKSDISRYEVLYKHGGIYLDTDMIWLKSDLERFLPLKTSSFIGVQEHLSDSFKKIKTPFISNGFICSIKKHSILKCCIDSLPERLSMSNKAFIVSGPGLLNSCIVTHITIIPTRWVFPLNFTGLSTGNELDYIKKALIFTKSGFEMPYLKNANFLDKLGMILERFIHV